jgi:hypothetical protein
VSTCRHAAILRAALPSLDVSEATQAGHVTRVLFDDDANPLGWISTFHTYGVVGTIIPENRYAG